MKKSNQSDEFFSFLLKVVFEYFWINEIIKTIKKWKHKLNIMKTN